MLSLILIKKIFSLFLILFSGTALVKLRIVKPEDSRVLSLLMLYLIVPCVTLSAFQVDYTPQIRDRLLLAFAAALLIHVVLILVIGLLKKLLHLTEVEHASIIYSNSGNLIVPLVVAILGKEWVIYSCAFMSVQNILLWSHAKGILCGDSRPDIKKIITNINMIAIAIGIILFFTRIRFPAPIQDSLDSVASMVGPSAMLVTGMLIGGIEFGRFLSYRRLPMVILFRLVLIPFSVLLILKYSGIAGLAPNGDMILLLTLLATATPSASTIVQMSQVYGSDADYASAINVCTMLLCILTMPVMVFIYQM